MELAFVAALQNLPANQRAVLILREVLGFSPRGRGGARHERRVGEQRLQRARKTVDEKLPDESQQATLRSLDDEELRELVESYMNAMERGDVEAVMGLLAEDAVWSMPPAAGLVHGTRRARTSCATARSRATGAGGTGRPRPTASRRSAATPGTSPTRPTGCSRSTCSRSKARGSAITSFINRSTLSREELFYQRYPEQPMDDSNTSVQAEAFGLPETMD